MVVASLVLAAVAQATTHMATTLELAWDLALALDRE